MGQVILWDASEPPYFDSDNRGPGNGRFGQIRIRKTYGDGPQKGKEQTFEELWRKAVFELYNITGAKDFERFAEEAAGEVDEGSIRHEQCRLRISGGGEDAGVLRQRVSALGQN